MSERDSKIEKKEVATQKSGQQGTRNQQISVQEMENSQGQKPIEQPAMDNLKLYQNNEENAPPTGSGGGGDNGQNPGRSSLVPLIVGNRAAPSGDSDTSAAGSPPPLMRRSGGQEHGTRVSVNDRLKMVTPPKTPTPIWPNPQTDDSVGTLRVYCMSHGLGKPKYSLFNRPPALHCYVMINDNVYSSYPQEFVDRESAFQGTARIAMERLQHAKQLSQAQGKDEEFIDRLHQELLQLPHGLLGHRLEDWYGKTFGHPPPSNWNELIRKSNKIRVDETITAGRILYAIYPVESNPTGSDMDIDSSAE